MHQRLSPVLIVGIANEIIELSIAAINIVKTKVTTIPIDLKFMNIIPPK